MQSGTFLEFSSGYDCILYASKGEVLAKVLLGGLIPVFSAGENHIGFSCDAVKGPAPRVKLTLISYGEPL